MQRLGHYFFSAAVFTSNQDIRVGRADPRDSIQHRLHGSGRGYELRASLNLEETILRSQAFCAKQGSTQFDLGAQDGQKPLVLPRLLDEVARSAPHGFNRQIHAAPRGHYDDGKIAVNRDDFRKERETLLPRSCVASVIQIDKYSIIDTGGQRFPKLLGRIDTVHAITLRMKQQLKGFENVLLVVCCQDARDSVVAGVGGCDGLKIVRLGRNRHKR